MSQSPVALFDGLAPHPSGLLPGGGEPSCVKTPELEWTLPGMKFWARIPASASWDAASPARSSIAVGAAARASHGPAPSGGARRLGERLPGRPSAKLEPGHQLPPALAQATSGPVPRGPARAGRTGATSGAKEGGLGRNAARPKLSPRLRDWSDPPERTPRPGSLRP
ncbi:hypothetical protein P7K49_011858 [Saguinus oedipus]|uniref:Uncharacterized protein n=1 Tax=Saguinus oedipus TaxID=9490 RepID=A0ABQ9VRW7_SAGOE|nr:hypothetical protein P7K49_011858 [Saguinus oedipus]